MRHRPKARPSSCGPALAASFGRGAAACRPLTARNGLSASFVDPALVHLAATGGTVRFGHRLRAVTLRDRPRPRSRLHGCKRRAGRGRFSGARATPSRDRRPAAQYHRPAPEPGHRQRPLPDHARASAARRRPLRGPDRRRRAVAVRARPRWPASPSARPIPWPSGRTTRSPISCGPTRPAPSAAPARRDRPRASSTSAAPPSPRLRSRWRAARPPRRPGATSGSPATGPTPAFPATIESAVRSGQTAAHLAAGFSAA